MQKPFLIIWSPGAVFELVRGTASQEYIFLVYEFNLIWILSVISCFIHDFSPGRKKGILVLCLGTAPHEGL